MPSHRVVLLAGFGLPPATLRPLANTLRAGGHEVHVAPLGLNIDCGERTTRAVLGLVDELRATAIVGHSRGGQLGLVAAVRRPDLIRALVTVGTPWSIGPPEKPGVEQVAKALRFVRHRGLDLMPSLECGQGPCCTAFRADLLATPTATWTALWSSTDRVAGDEGRPPRSADEEFDLRLGHLAMVTTPRGRRAIADRLR
ncbi:MAG: alpha/beta fold hydrolase [Actinomycetota bacterium]|nr:alpha/beta fold hydrolase [Actinomycetota bacterium]